AVSPENTKRAPSKAIQPALRISHRLLCLLADAPLARRSSRRLQFPACRRASVPHQLRVARQSLLDVLRLPPDSNTTNPGTGWLVDGLLARVLSAPKGHQGRWEGGARVLRLKWRRHGASHQQPSASGN